MCCCGDISSVHGFGGFSTIHLQYAHDYTGLFMVSYCSISHRVAGGFSYQREYQTITERNRGRHTRRAAQERLQAVGMVATWRLVRRG